MGWDIFSIKGVDEKPWNALGGSRNNWVSAFSFTINVLNIPVIKTQNDKKRRNTQIPNIAILTVSYSLVSV